MNRSQRILAAGALVLAPAFGYIRLGFLDSGAVIPLHRYDNKAIQFYINEKIVAGATSSASGAPVKTISDSSDPVTGIREAFLHWGRVGGDLKFLPLKSTTAAHDVNDGRNTVVMGGPEDLAVLGVVPGRPSSGALAITANSWYSQDGMNADGASVKKGDIADSDIVINPTGFLFSTDGSTAFDIQTVMTHEVGHALGQDHTGVLGSTMFPFSAVGNSAVLGQKLISADERAFVAAVYPSPGTATGTLTGKVTLAGAPLKRGLVAAADLTSGVVLGGLTDADGVYSLLVPPGSYIVSAEPFNSIVAPGNISLDSSQVTVGFQHTFAGGATPSTFAVSNGGTATADFAVNVAAGTLSLPQSAIGVASGRNDIKSVAGMTGPITIPSGNAVDIAFLGGGFDDTTIVQVFGAGISVRPGSTRVDTSVTSSAGPLIRATLDITARQTPSLATLILSKGAGRLALTGYFVIVPPKPVFTSKSIVNAASYVGQNNDGVVSPGGLYSIYAATGSALGPTDGVGNEGYDVYGKLSNVLGGVTVTFDGVPAPMFFSASGQLNLQVPFELAGKTTTLAQVNYNGSLSDRIAVNVTPSQPAFFTITGFGTDSIAGNENGKLNSVNNPEAKEHVVSIYGTGLGKLSYNVATGAGAGAPPAGFTGNNTCVLGGTVPVPVAFTGWTPSAVGLAQWSMVIPQNSPTGAVTVRCTNAAGASTQQGTLYIK